MVEDYYTAMGWGKTSGKPAMATLERLSLEELAE
jgi:aldehyde:ferredoxin oxidoreductase